MAATKGNRFWEARSTHGRKPLFENPEALASACEEYFRWIMDNPLIKEKAFCSQGEIIIHEEEIPKPFTIGGLCLFLDITETGWRGYKKREDFYSVTSQVEKTIRDQKFSGAAIGVYNANIIARDLGLKDNDQTIIVNNNMNPEQYLKDKGLPVPELEVDDVEEGENDNSSE